MDSWLGNGACWAGDAVLGSGMLLGLHELGARPRCTYTAHQLVLAL